MVHSYAEFTERLISRFDCKDTELYYRELAHLRQTRHAEAYVNEFQHIAVMVPDMPQRHSVMLFIEGLQDRLKGWVCAFNLTTLKDTIDVTLRLDTTPTSYQTDKKSFKDSRPPQKANASQFRDGQTTRPPRMDQETQNDLRRRKLCFSCKEPWEPRHHCMGKGKVHLIEVTSEFGDEEIPGTNTEDSMEETRQEQPQLEIDIPEPLAAAKVTMATLSSYPRFHAFRLKVWGCTKWIPQLSIQMGDYTLTDDFYVLPLEDYDLEFLSGGKKVILRATSDGGLKEVSSHRMESIIRHDDVIWATHCFVKSKTPTHQDGRAFHVDIQSIMDWHDRVFGDIPPCVPPDRGFEHGIEMEDGAKLVITSPYHHPRAYKDEIKKTIHELLDMGFIRPSSSPFASSVIDLHSGYHQIHVRAEDVHKTAFCCHYGYYEFLVMPFGLTNAPATFQSCMNRIFNKQLRKLVLVFFDDILIYNHTWEDHIRHLEEVLSIMESQSLFAKLSKYEFGLIEILYLGHVTSADGVKEDEEKIRAIRDWPSPQNITELRGFLGLCAYYRRFVRGFPQLAAPLTDLTKNGAFKWTKQAQGLFGRLKEVMSTCLVLALPDFSQPFVLECDASGVGIRTKLNDRQQKWVSKIQAYDFDIEFVKGKNNTVVDALSRRPSLAALCSLSEISADWKSQLLVEYSKDQHACEVMDGLVLDDKYSVVDDVIYYKSRVYLVPGSQLKEWILHAYHDTPTARHPGYGKTYREVRERFFSKGLKDDVLRHEDVLQMLASLLGKPVGSSTQTLGRKQEVNLEMLLLDQSVVGLVPDSENLDTSQAQQEVGSQPMDTDQQLVAQEGPISSNEEKMVVGEVSLVAKNLCSIGVKSDFNAILELCEKKGGVKRLEPSSILLWDSISDLNLVDIKPSNGFIHLEQPKDRGGLDCGETGLLHGF
ncbi:uncharacterized protein LOC131026858 [Cryptomeria japonica]|uniref:uncharacterized protein LOC131026858 n=1 Tax=Cryptomeria japonica TaxID=3369 RepID=UPI0027D9D88E|nr:uncharacterized protein LOC131026858 [Cryptomeria japonica]